MLLLANPVLIPEIHNEVSVACEHNPPLEWARKDLNPGLSERGQMINGIVPVPRGLTTTIILDPTRPFFQTELRAHISVSRNQLQNNLLIRHTVTHTSVHTTLEIYG